jgi:hypothetical protein
MCQLIAIPSLLGPHLPHLRVGLRTGKTTGGNWSVRHYNRLWPYTQDHTIVPTLCIWSGLPLGW